MHFLLSNFSLRCCLPFMLFHPDSQISNGFSVSRALKWEHRDKRFLRWLIHKRKSTKLRALGIAWFRYCRFFAKINTQHRRGIKIETCPQRSQDILRSVFLCCLLIFVEEKSFYGFTFHALWTRLVSLSDEMSDFE